jgi:hypothetical protein
MQKGATPNEPANPEQLSYINKVEVIKTALKLSEINSASAGYIKPLHKE